MSRMQKIALDAIKAAMDALGFESRTTCSLLQSERAAVIGLTAELLKWDTACAMAKARKLEAEAELAKIKGRGG